LLNSDRPEKEQHPVIDRLLERDAALDLFITFLGVANVGEHGRRKFCREYSDPSAILHIDFDLT
jgi:hypothetical protein